MAIGAARLGLSTALAAPLGQDSAGDLIGPTIQDEGVRLVGKRCPRTPVTAVMPIRQDRAMVTYDPGVPRPGGRRRRARPARRDRRPQPAGRRARRRPRVPDRRRRRRPRIRRPPPWRRIARAGLFIEQREALVLTGAGSPEEAAEMIGARVPIVVVSLGADGAVAVSTAAPVSRRRLRRRHVDRHHRRGRPVRRRVGLGRRGRDECRRALRGPRSTPPCRCASRRRGRRDALGEFMDEGSRRGLPAPPARRPRVAYAGGEIARRAPMALVAVAALPLCGCGAATRDARAARRRPRPPRAQQPSAALRLAARAHRRARRRPAERALRPRPLTRRRLLGAQRLRRRPARLRARPQRADPREVTLTGATASTGRTSRSAAARCTSATSATTPPSAPTSPSTGSSRARPRRAPSSRCATPTAPTTPRRCWSTPAAADRSSPRTSAARRGLRRCRAPKAPRR